MALLCLYCLGTACGWAGWGKVRFSKVRTGEMALVLEGKGCPGWEDVVHTIIASS
ncbi:hypothetical protein I79_005878 [Cricetulus griseus]|uniref:Uncharacterized protein n=1 Tax=Cricetulus griseus TaxID=10029 RepID=G3H6C3_CRIGR|nr:hypothetical protein I79_005878 [Cricetulus griseus]